MPHEQLMAAIGQWEARLTGLSESWSAELALEQKLDLIAQWHASKVVAEQMVVLTIAQAMVEDGVTARDLCMHLGSREAKATALGRFSFVTGIAEWPGMVQRVFLPLLRVSGYRPFLRYDTAKAVLDLCTHPNLAGGALRPEQVADTLYLRGLSPHVSKRTLRTMVAFAETHPEAGPRLWASLSVVRQQAAKTIAGLPEIGERVEGLEATASDEAASAEGGC